jgi:hypothetical protein
MALLSMKKTLVITLASVAVVFPAIAAAHVVDAQTSLSINRVPARVIDPGTRVVIFGRLRSSAGETCIRRKVIRLMLVRSGPDRLLATDVTDAEGEYRFVRRPRSDQRVYTRFAGSFESSYEHAHACRSDNSRAILINVRGR